MTDGDQPRALAKKQDKVIDSYSFGISSSAYLNMCEGGRVKVSDQLNHTRINLMKIAFVQDSVQIGEPEVTLLSFFEKTEEQKKYSKIYMIAPSSEPYEELKCGDVIRAGDVEYVVREFVDGRDRTKYSGMVKSPEDLNATLFEESLLLYDAGKKEGLDSEKITCKICGFTEQNLKQGNPLIFFNPADKSFTYCKDCLDKFVQQNTRMSFKSNGVIEYFIDNMCVPGTGIEFPPKYKANHVPFELVNMQYPFSPYHLVLERINYRRPPGHKEGFILRFGMADQKENVVSFGSDPKDNVYMLDSGLSPHHFSISYSEGVFMISDHKDSTGTFVAKCAKWEINEYFKKRAVICRDTIIKFSFVHEQMMPPADCIDCRVDLFPQVFPTKAYETNAEEQHLEQSEVIETKPDNHSDIDEGVDTPDQSNTRSVRQFSSRFKPLVARITLA
jgi:hypothetical protein